MHPTLATLMVAKDAAEQGDTWTRFEMLDALVEVEYGYHIGYANDDGTWATSRSWLSCAWCGGKHRGVISEEHKQANDCASHVFCRDGVWYAVGGYGSTHHDMTLYRFVQNVPREPADPVCDACLNVRLAGGDMVIEQEGVL